MPNQEDVRWLLEGKDAWNSRREENPVWRPDLSEALIQDLLEQHQRITESGKPDLRSYNLSDTVFSNAWLRGVDMTDADVSSADFSNAFLYGVDMTDANVSHANFTHSWLDRGILTRATCISTDFADASLREAILSKAKLFLAKFPNAKLVKANLEGASCTLTDFAGADLTDARFNDAILEEEQLVGADLTNSRLWKATMRSITRPQWGYSKLKLDEDEHIDSVADLLRHMEELEGNYPLRDDHEPTLLYYRGESEEHPYMVPSVMRASKPGEYPLRSNESDMLVDLMTHRPSDFAGELSALGQLMTAQHFGLPTRLLDVTRNPLVALFHATARKKKSDESPGQLHVLAVRRSMVKPYTSHSVSVVANFTRLRRSEQNLLLTKTMQYTEEDNDLPPTASYKSWRSGGYLSTMSRLVQYVRLEHPSFEERIEPQDLFRVFVVEPQRSNERIVAQSGAFLLSAFHERFDESEVQCRTKQLSIYHHYTIRIPHERKDCIRKQLRSLNISEETMYPGLEKAAEAVKLGYGGSE